MEQEPSKPGCRIRISVYEGEKMLATIISTILRVLYQFYYMLAEIKLFLCTKTSKVFTHGIVKMKKVNSFTVKVNGFS